MIFPARLLPCFLALLLTSCSKSPPPLPVFKFENWDRTQPKAGLSEEEVVALFGPGEKVQDDNTAGILAAQKLPPNTEFWRWHDPRKPGVYYHEAFMDGKTIGVRNVWKKGENSSTTYVAPK